MEVKVIKEEKNELHIEFEGESHTFTNLLKGELWKAGADNTYYTIPHPLAGNPVLVVSGKSPKKLVETACKKIKKEADEFVKSIN